MSRLDRWETLQQEMATRGLDLSSEAGRTLCSWLWRELNHCPPRDWRLELAGAAEVALEIYLAFVAEFDAQYMQEGGWGEAWVRQFLRNRFGFAAATTVEAVLNHIRDLRPHLLEAFRAKYQRVLFGPRTFRPGGVRGYLRQVAWVESGKAPVEELRRFVDTDPDTLDTWLATAEDPAAGEDYDRRPRQLAAFWSEANGFSRSQRLEGLMSLALGGATDEPELQERCRAYLEGKLPGWDVYWERLTVRLRQLLARQEQLEAWLPRTWHWPDRDQLLGRLARLRTRLDNLRGRLRQHLDRLPPRPREVQALLAGFVDQKVGTVRFQRIGREIALFEDRVRTGARNLEIVFRRDLPVPHKRLLRDVRAHLDRQLPSPREHGLDEAERARRRRDHALWLEAGLQVLGRPHRLMDELFRTPPASAVLGRALLHWLGDVRDLYEFGILDRVGVIGGLRSRHGWRLDRLLRGRA
jgi:hypothetical protein